VPEDDHDHGYDGQEGDEALQMMLSVNVLDVDPDDLDYQGRSAPRKSAVGLFEPPGERMRRHNLTCKLESSVFECLRGVYVESNGSLFCVVFAAVRSVGRSPGLLTPEGSEVHFLFLLFLFLVLRIRTGLRVEFAQN